MGIHAPTLTILRIVHGRKLVCVLPLTVPFDKRIEVFQGVLRDNEVAGSLWQVWLSWRRKNIQINSNQAVKTMIVAVLS